MACFLVPAVQAVAVTTATKLIERKVKSGAYRPEQVQAKRRLLRQLTWLSNLLWGGVALLAFEHLWHGEITPWFPFLTAATEPSEIPVMLHEMATIGVTMAVLVSLAWGGAIWATNAIRRRQQAQA